MDKNYPTSGLGIVLSGPSGAGKNTILEALCQRRPDIVVLLSWTTRSPRPGETPGVDYHFVGKDEFTSQIAADGFAEWALVHGEWYGTPRVELEQHLARGDLVLLIKDTQGALCLQELDLPLKLVFIAPPSLAVLEQRLTDRGTEDAPTLARRLARAEYELSEAKSYDLVLTNHTVATCTDQLLAQINQWETGKAPGPKPRTL